MIFPAFAVIFILWLELNAKASTSNQLKQEIVTNCTDSHCVDAVNSYFSKCFNPIYEENGSQQLDALATQELTVCIERNAKSK
ncbi:MAG: hypothetical protein AAF652_14865 [Cyanobacteria bacterium P01_C01_bin.72]